MKREYKYLLTLLIILTCALGLFLYTRGQQIYNYCQSYADNVTQNNRQFVPTTEEEKIRLGGANVIDSSQRALAECEKRQKLFFLF